MSSIAGIFYRDGRQVDRLDLDRMIQNASRWPADDIGFWVDGNVGLAHRMVRMTPESICEKLPMLSVTGAVITADCRIDNREDLIPLLSFEDRAWDRIPDSEIILQAYEKWGEPCLNWLVGDFAFAIWDPREKKIFCARDLMGVRPFLYYISDTCFVFGSSIQSIHQIHDIPRELNELKVAYTLCMIYQDQEPTYYRGINNVLGGESITVSMDSTSRNCWWNFEENGEISYRRESDYIEHFKEIFEKSVRSRLRSIHPVGAYLSGGLDSTSVACVARNLLRQEGRDKLYTYSAIYPSVAGIDPRIDEREYIDSVTSNNEFHHRNLVADETEIIFDDLWNGDEPIEGFNLYMDRLIHNAARRDGVKVLLTGMDGDSVVSWGYQRYYELLESRNYFTLAYELLRRSKKINKPFLSLLKRCFASRGYNNDIHYATDYIDEYFLDKVGLKSQILYLKKSKRTMLNSREAHLENLKSGICQLAMGVLGKYGSATGVEMRHPFFDRRIIQYCLFLPSKFKMRHGFDRWIVRKAMEGCIPQNVFSRAQKQNLSACFNSRLLQYHESQIAGSILSSSSTMSSFIDLDCARTAFEKYQSNPIKYGNYSIFLFLITLLSMWYEQKFRE